MSEKAPVVAKRRILTLDSNVFIGAAKADERYRRECLEIIRLIPERFVLAEPSIIYQEVCGTIARRVGSSEAAGFAAALDKLVPPELLVVCDKSFCLSHFGLCSEYGIYAVDALYLGTAISSGAVLVSLDEEDFISRLKNNRHLIEAYHIRDFLYFKDSKNEQSPRFTGIHH